MYVIRHQRKSAKQRRINGVEHENSVSGGGMKKIKHHDIGIKASSEAKQSEMLNAATQHGA